MKKTILVILLVLIFVFGLSTGQYKHFPYKIIYKIFKGKEYYPDNSSVPQRFNDVSVHQISPVQISDSTGIYLTYGQSNSANNGQIGYQVKNGVYQFFNGETYKYKDPSLGATGQAGSVWGLVGDKLIENSIYDKVIFSNCGWDGIKIEELKEGHHFDYLVKNYNELIEQFGRVDGILYHQGESDNSFISESNENYYYDFVEFINNLKDKGIEIPIYLSRVSFCGKRMPFDKTLIKIQNKIIEDFDIVFKGPNTDLLNDRKYRLPDYCHFSMLGHEKFSDMWVKSIINK